MQHNHAEPEVCEFFELRNFEKVNIHAMWELDISALLVMLRRRMGIQNTNHWYD